jgi:nucleoside 2-deoxyribosyltransferase-like protein
VQRARRGRPARLDEERRARSIVRLLRVYFAGPLFTPYERSFIDECAAALRADGFEVFVPHEHELATGGDVTAAAIFATDRSGIERADAMLAILDGPSVDDGTACEIGMFHGLMQSDPSKRGIVGLLTDMRGTRGESTGINLFVQGAIEDAGRIVVSIEEARDVLRAWR